MFLPLPHPQILFSHLLLTYPQVVYMPNIMSQNRLQSSQAISKLFYFLYFITTLTALCRFSSFSLQ